MMACADGIYKVVNIVWVHTCLKQVCIFGTYLIFHDSCALCILRSLFFFLPSVFLPSSTSMTLFLVFIFDITFMLTFWVLSLVFNQ